MIDAVSLLAALSRIAAFLGLTDVAHFWYLALVVLMFAYLNRKYKQLKTLHYEFMERTVSELAKLQRKDGEIIGRMDALQSRQDLQKSYLEEWEKRYRDMAAHLAEFYEKLDSLREKVTNLRFHIRLIYARLRIRKAKKSPD